MAVKKQTINRYYIVNPSGAVHEVTRDHAANRLKQIGYRMASKDEVKAYKGVRMQRHNAPIAKPFSAEPVPEIEPVPDGE